MTPFASLGYDVLGRLTLRTEGGEFARWYYDTATGKGIGKLHYSERRNASLQLITSDTTAYDPAYSRPISTTRVVDGTSYASSITYDTYGRTTVLTYPTGVKVRQAYNAFSVLKEVRRQVGASAAANDPIVWMALPDTTNGALLSEARYLLGNGVTTTRLASRATGRVRNIDSGILGGSGLQAINLDYDRAGNVLRRIDEAINLTDTAWYDALNRLTGFTSAQGYVLNDVDVHYSALGNITWKSDVGSYTYGGPRPHAVTSITSTSTQNLIYDANGNMTSGLGRTIAYTAYNQISGISQSGASSTFTFSADRDRIKQVITGRGTVVYGSALYERFTPTSGLVEHTHYIMTPAGRTASYKTWTGSAVTETRYFHTDHLGSITLVTGEKGGVVQRFRYDPWGKRLGATADPTAWMTLSHANNGGFRRGFTDHEHLEDLGLIHMNGRIFDPVLARFLSADPNIDGVSDSQGYNRYSYVHNNPLNATDPSGYLSLKEVLPAIVAVVVTVVVTVVTWGAGTGATTGFWASFQAAAGAAASGASYTAVVAGAFAGGFASGFSGSLLNGGSIGDAFKAGVVGGAWGAVTALASAGIGGFFKDVTPGVLRELSRAMTHGTVGGLVTEAQGGEFRHGFYSSAASSAFGHSRAGQKLMASNIAVSTATSMAIGGTVSVLGGGKFANGAVTSAFQHLFNQVATESGQEAKHPRTLILLEEGLSEEWGTYKDDAMRIPRGDYKVYDRVWDTEFEIEYALKNKELITLRTYADQESLISLINDYADSVDRIIIMSHGTDQGHFSVGYAHYELRDDFGSRFDAAIRSKFSHRCCGAEGPGSRTNWRKETNELRRMYGLEPKTRWPDYKDQ